MRTVLTLVVPHVSAAVVVGVMALIVEVILLLLFYLLIEVVYDDISLYLHMLNLVRFDTTISSEGDEKPVTLVSAVLGLAKMVRVSAPIVVTQGLIL